MFKSNIARYDFIKTNINDPGRYSPEKIEKKSHIVNFEKKWIWWNLKRYEKKKINRKN